MVPYYTTKYEFPVTNHILGITEENTGWIRGIMADDLPFEAEMWEKGDETDVAFIIPAIYLDILALKLRDSSKNNSKQEKQDNLVYFRYEVDQWDSGVLAIGMVDNGYEENLYYIQNYVEILVNNELIEFISSLYNGNVQYLTDVNGNDFAKVVVTLKDSDGKYAICPLFFEKYEANKRKSNLRVIKKGKV